MSLIDNKWTLVQILAWHRSGDKPLSEPMLTQFIDAYVRYYGRSVNVALFNAMRYSFEDLNLKQSFWEWNL